MRENRKNTWIACLVLIATVAAPSSAHAVVSKDVKYVLRASAYGAIGGTALGLASLPFSQSLKTVFMGSSIGLYLGTALGLLLVSGREDTSVYYSQKQSEPAVSLDDAPKKQETPYEASLQQTVSTSWTVLEF